MDRNWTIIKNWLSEHASHIKEELNPGITDEEINTLQAKIGVKFPSDFLEFYKIHNGQDSNSEGLIDTEELLSFDRIADEWSIWKDLLDKGTFENNSSEPNTGIKNNWWNPLWIPITYDGSGNHFCLDLDPAPEGTYGQIIRMWHDDPERSLEANSFTEWITQYTKNLQSGEYIYSEDWGGIINKKDA